MGEENFLKTGEQYSELIESVSEKTASMFQVTTVDRPEGDSDVVSGYD